jgi:anti-sigma factor RsiW
MPCEHNRELLGAYFDGELDVQARRDVAAHLQACADCATALAEIGRVSGQLAAVGRERPPRRLRSRIVAALAKAEAPRTSWIAWRLDARATALMRQAAGLILACGLTALATALVFSRAEQSKQLEGEIVSAHIRSLLQDSPIQVASADTHTVKPWFTGRLDFSPPVKDLTPEGFQLVGGRVDYIGERRVAALVYRRHLHVVTVFLWPSLAGELAPHHEAHNGYNVLTWKKGGIAYWAVSDLNEEELRLLQGLLA